MTGPATGPSGAEVAVAAAVAVSADAIVVAAGSSHRMGGTDKLTASVGGRPLLAWTLAAIAGAAEVERIVVVVAEGSQAMVRAAAWLPAAVVEVVVGGSRRQESVAAGLAALIALDRPRATESAERVVLVHDGGRPLVRPDLVGAVARAAAVHGAAIPVVPIVETVKRIEAGRVIETIDRSVLGAAQTPQGVQRAILLAALARYPADGPQTWTDEAGLLEACRFRSMPSPATR